MLIGQNGILNRAQEAKEKTSTLQDLEYLQLKATESLTDYYQENNSLGEDEYILKKWAEDSENNIDVNQGEKTVVYNERKYNIADIIGTQSEKSRVTQENMKQITISNATGDDKTLLLEGKIRLIIEENDTSMRAAVPNGFYYVTGKPSTGLVISDRYGDDDSNSRRGNQFVWVPCSGNKGVVYEKENGLAATWKKKYSGKSWWYLTYNTGKKDENNKDIYADVAEESWTDYGGIIESVRKYGGFYVARYEAGVPENATFYANNNNSIYSISKNPSEEQILNAEEENKLIEQELLKKLIPVSKKNNQCWNFITHDSAEKVSKTMYYNNKTIMSSLIDSYAWDTILEWMTTKIDVQQTDNEYGILQNLGNDSSSKGNYYNNYNINLKNVLYALHRYATSKKVGINDTWDYATRYKKGELVTGAMTDINKIKEYNDFETNDIDTNIYDYTIRKEIATGASEETKVKNIYDIGGNMWEWTTEEGTPDNGEIQFVLRGGGFNNYGSGNPISTRNGRGGKLAYSYDIGFRVVLYIN